jgi:hypothetical protein
MFNSTGPEVSFQQYMVRVYVIRQHVIAPLSAMSECLVKLSMVSMRILYVIQVFVLGLMSNNQMSRRHSKREN